MSAPRLTPADRDAIARDYQAGRPVAAIAREHGVDPAYPSIIARRRGLAQRFPPREAVQSPTIRWVLGRARRRASEIRVEARAARDGERDAKLRRDLAALDERARACFERCRADGLSIAKSLSLAQDDQAMRQRRAVG